MEAVFAYVSHLADTSAIPALMDFIRVPSLSPMFDTDWERKGLIETAMNVMLNWALAQGLAGLTYEVVRQPGVPPLLYIDIAGESPCLLFYGHLDKQPATVGWSDFCGAYSPVIQEGYLYGRGCADDGYALTSVVLAVKACQQFGVRHRRCVVVLENEEESGSPHLVEYVERVKSRVDGVEAVICLDTSVGDYGHLWLVESLRGLLRFNLTATVLTSPLHSGTACGIVPSPSSVLFSLLNRLEDPNTGQLLIPELYSSIRPEQYKRALSGSMLVVQARKAAYETIPGVAMTSSDDLQLTLNRSLRPTLCVIGLDGAPSTAAASSVMLSQLTLTCSIRLPPGVDGNTAFQAVEKELLRDPPHAAKVEVTGVTVAQGWKMEENQGRVMHACEEACQDVFADATRRSGSGGSIPFVSSLQALFPQSSILLLGASGPDSHAHGPNERLNLAFYKQFTVALFALLHRLSVL